MVRTSVPDAQSMSPATAGQVRHRGSGTRGPTEVSPICERRRQLKFLKRTYGVVDHRVKEAGVVVEHSDVVDDRTSEDPDPESPTGA